MNLARVRGTVVATRRSDKAVQWPAQGVDGAKWLLVEECDQSGKGKGDYLVAIGDTIDQQGATVFAQGNGE